MLVNMEATAHSSITPPQRKMPSRLPVGTTTSMMRARKEGMSRSSSAAASFIISVREMTAV